MWFSFCTKERLLAYHDPSPAAYSSGRRSGFLLDPGVAVWTKERLPAKLPSVDLEEELAVLRNVSTLVQTYMNSSGSSLHVEVLEEVLWPDLFGWSENVLAVAVEMEASSF